ncbi:hypothetical protein SAMN04515618_10180 [Collimonas sp. OK307]|nr:hypothetical protein [Collimonas sp. OK307]SFH61147.1 hypothetical protein SAMN04515618_10180 [Collimonas sp. OK307]
MKSAKIILAICVTLFTLAAAGCAQLDPMNAASGMSPDQGNMYSGQ